MKNLSVILMIMKITLKRAFNHGLILNKNHKIIKLSQFYGLKSFSDLNTELRKKNFEEKFLQGYEQCCV